MALPELDLDYVLIGVIIVFACYLCTRRLRTVLTVDALLCIVEGTCTAVYAKDVLEKFTKDISIDMQHEYLVLIRVALLFMPALTWLSCWNTSDMCVLSALAVSRMVGYGLSVAFMAIEHYRLDMFTPYHMLYSILPVSLWVGVMAVQVYRTRAPVYTRPRTSDLSGPLQYDLALLLVFAAADIIAPELVGYYLSRKVEPLHAYLHRINGSMIAGAAVLPWIGQRFRYTDNKRSILTARVLCCSALLAVTLRGYKVGWLPDTDSTLAFMAQAGLLTLPALLGALSTDSGKGWQLPPLRTFDPLGLLGGILKRGRSLRRYTRAKLRPTSPTLSSSASRSTARSRSEMRSSPETAQPARPKRGGHQGGAGSRLGRVTRSSQLDARSLPRPDPGLGEGRVLRSHSRLGAGELR